ncbi:DUF58 domain-containing protein [Actinomadura montaniterrae]|uniref:DUF58 domain-containing protein n=1 Tax=Actinomadura montaniterrae TaxID=1803903 RepID=A0A6L3VZL3_9ACTN|nr:DUF58 domain-containing protein [Actinomadura montaniterrae]KAB2385922.1 DUF58 domain-containing protein [Actinomadura montaniterrae]
MAVRLPRPTARGWGLLSAGSVLGGGGLALGYLAPGLLGVLSLLTLTLALILARRPAPIRVHRRATASRVAAGAAVTVVLEIMPGRDHVSTVAEHFTGPGGSALLQLGAVRSTIRYEVVARGRGVIEAGPLSLVRTDPLGLVRAVRVADDMPIHVLVHPTHHELAAVSGTGGGGGRDTSSARARAVEGAFAGLREYTLGDDIGKVHWRTSARRGRLMVREDADAARPGLTVLIDDRHGPRELDALVEAAASIVMSGRDLPVEVRLASGARSPAVAGTTAHLDMLAQAGARPDADFPAACAGLRSLASGRAVVLLSTKAAVDAASVMKVLAGGRALSLVGMIGPGDDGDVPAPATGVRLLHAADPAGFATRWNESRWWVR